MSAVLSQAPRAKKATTCSAAYALTAFTLGRVAQASGGKGGRGIPTALGYASSGRKALITAPVVSSQRLKETEKDRVVGIFWGITRLPYGDMTAEARNICADDSLRVKIFVVFIPFYAAKSKVIRIKKGVSIFQGIGAHVRVI